MNRWVAVAIASVIKLASCHPITKGSPSHSRMRNKEHDCVTMPSRPRCSSSPYSLVIPFRFYNSLLLFTFKSIVLEDQGGNLYRIEANYPTINSPIRALWLAKHHEAVGSRTWTNEIEAGGNRVCEERLTCH